MATGVCYTQSGGVKRYEDRVSISLIKGIHDLPTIKNDVLSVANENHYSFEVSSSYKLHSKGNYSDDMPLIFVTYYPSSGKSPCYFNFDYNYIDIEISLEFVWPSYVKFINQNYISINIIIYINGEPKTITKKSDLKFKIVKGSSISINPSGINNMVLEMIMSDNSTDDVNYQQQVYNNQEKIILSDTYYSNITESTTIHVKFTNREIYMIPLYDTNSDYDDWLSTKDPIHSDNKFQCYSSDANRASKYTLITNNEVYAYATIMCHEVYKNHRIGAFIGTIVLPSLEKPTRIIDYNTVKNNYTGYEVKRNSNPGVLWSAAKQVKTTYGKTIWDSNYETLNNDSVQKLDETSVLNWPDGFPKYYTSNEVAQKIIDNGKGSDGSGGFTQYDYVLINEMFVDVDSNYNHISINYKYRKVGTVHYVSQQKGNASIICDNSVSSNQYFKQNMPYNGVLLGMKELDDDTIVSAGNISFGGINAVYTGSFLTLSQEGKIGNKHSIFLNWIDPSKDNANDLAGYFMIGRYYRKGHFLCAIGARFAVYPGYCKKDVIDQWKSYNIFSEQ